MKRNIDDILEHIKQFYEVNYYVNVKFKECEYHEYHTIICIDFININFHIEQELDYAMLYNINMVELDGFLNGILLNELEKIIKKVK